MSDVETADGDLTYEIVTPPAHGTATATTYTPDADFNGSDSFTYRVTDRGDPDNCSSAPCDAPADLDDGDGVDHGRSGQRRADWRRR